MFLVGPCSQKNYNPATKTWNTLWISNSVNSYQKTSGEELLFNPLVKLLKRTSCSVCIFCVCSLQRILDRTPITLVTRSFLCLHRLVWALCIKVRSPKGRGAALKLCVKRSAVYVHTLLHFDPGKHCTHGSGRDRDRRTSVTSVTAGHGSSAAAATPRDNSSFTYTATGNQHGSESWTWQRADSLACTESLKMGLISISVCVLPTARQQLLNLWRDESMESRRQSGPPKQMGPAWHWVSSRGKINAHSCKTEEKLIIILSQDCFALPVQSN